MAKLVPITVNSAKIEPRTRVDLDLDVQLLRAGGYDPQVVMEVESRGSISEKKRPRLKSITSYSQPNNQPNTSTSNANANANATTPPDQVAAALCTKSESPLPHATCSCSGPINYDQLLVQAKRVYQLTIQLEQQLQPSQPIEYSNRALDRAIVSTIGTDAAITATAVPSSSILFVDPFNTHLTVTCRPWQLVEQVVEDLQQYIPHHLRDWCKIGVRSRLDNCITTTTTAASNRPSSSSTQTSCSLLKLSRIAPIADSLRQASLVEAKLVSYPSVTKSSELTLSPVPSSIEAATSLARELVAFGVITIVLRHPLDLSLSSSSRLVASPRIHILEMEVFGLDLLSDVMTRLTSYASLVFSWSIKRTQLYRLIRPFTLPLDQITPNDPALQMTPLSLQQTILSAQLASNQEQILLIDIQEEDSIPVSTMKSSTITIYLLMLTGQQVPMELSHTSTIDQIKTFLLTRYSHATSSPTNQLRLIHERVALEDDHRNLTSYGIRSGDSITVLEIDSTMKNLPDPLVAYGQVGLHPLHCHSSNSRDLLHSFLSWSIPTTSECRLMTPEQQIELLLQSRKYLYQLHHAIHTDQTITGHSSKGERWINQQRIQFDLPRSRLTYELTDESLNEMTATTDQDCSLISTPKPHSNKRPFTLTNESNDTKSNRRTPTTTKITSTPTLIDLTHSSSDQVLLKPKSLFDPPRSPSGSFAPLVSASSSPSPSQRRRVIVDLC